jgi:hypothetical protein
LRRFMNVMLKRLRASITYEQSDSKAWTTM